MMLPRHRTIAYLRVSKPDQDVEKNKADILFLANHHALGPVQFVEETVPRGEFPGVAVRLLRFSMTYQGDTLIVSELSGLAAACWNVWKCCRLPPTKGLHLHAVKGAWQLDDSMQSKIIAMAFAMAAEIERDLIAQRTREALRAKKAAGGKLGRPPRLGKSKLDPYQPEIEALLANGSTQRFIAKRYGTSEANLCNWIRSYWIPGS